MKRYLLLIFSLILSSLLASCIPNNTPHISGRIVFVSDQNGENDIYLMDTNGQNVRRLTDNPATDDNPKWSPDGGKIVFMSKRDGSKKIYTMNADGSNQVRLTKSVNSDEDFPDWSPNGKKIVFSSGQYLVVLDIATGDMNQIATGDSWDDVPSWSPDGLKLVFRYGLHSKVDIHIINQDGSGDIALTDSNWKKNTVVIPTWSPDGTKIAFGKINFGDITGTFTMSPDGSNLKMITSGCTGGAWSPDSKWIVCESRGNNGLFDVYIINIADGTKYRLTDTPYSEFSPDWSP